MLYNANPRNRENKNQRTMVKRNSNEAQGPCQDSIRLNLLHPKLFRCTTSIGVLNHMGIITNSRIGIKIYSLYQFTNIVLYGSTKYLFIIKCIDMVLFFHYLQLSRLDRWSSGSINPWYINN